jgi:hypothetical protein
MALVISNEYWPLDHTGQGKASLPRGSKNQGSKSGRTWQVSSPWQYLQKCLKLSLLDWMMLNEVKCRRLDQTKSNNCIGVSGNLLDLQLLNSYTDTRHEYDSTMDWIEQRPETCLPQSCWQAVNLLRRNVANFSSMASICMSYFSKTESSSLEKRRHADWCHGRKVWSNCCVKKRRRAF